MNLNELLAKYDREEATLRFAEQNGFTLDEARMYIEIALGESLGDVVRVDEQGGLHPLTPPTSAERPS
jgi:hypothetical protein